MKNVQYLSGRLFGIFFIISMFVCFQCFAGDSPRNLLENPKVKVTASYAERGSCDKAENLIDANVNTDFSITGEDATAFVVIDLGRGCVIESVEITNGKSNPVGWLNSLEVGPDPKHFRELLGRKVNLPVWRGGDSETISITPAVGRYVRIGFFSHRKTGAISGIKITGSENRPERHLMCWSTDVNRDFLSKMDYFQNDLKLTDVWLDYVKTAFYQGNDNSGLQIWIDSGALKEFQKRNIRYWLGEHEFFCALVNSPEDLLDDLRWNTTINQIKQVYSQAKELGFRGIVVDGEDYGGVTKEAWEKYSKFTSHPLGWSFQEHFGYNGMYYQRGLQVGKAIKSVWNPIVIALWEGIMFEDKHGAYDGHYWFFKGINDAGLEIWIAPEKTYGAGNNEMKHPDILPHLSHWLVKMPEFIPEVYKAFPFATRVLPGFHPWNTRIKRACYLPKYLDEQLRISENTVQGFWMYNEGNMHGGDPREVLDESFLKPYGVTAQDYIDVFKK
jgi:hypothetical protein